MVTNSILEAAIHHRRFGQQNKFSYSVFYLCLDLFDLDNIASRLRLFSQGFPPSLFSLSRSDYLNFGASSIAENFTLWLNSQGYSQPIDKLYLISHPRTFGYSFNPISLFLYQSDNIWNAAIEVDNTFGEAKMYHLGPLDSSGRVSATHGKNFYVSPFIGLDTDFTFEVKLMAKGLLLIIKTERQGETILSATLKGDWQPLTDARLLKNFIRHPHITAKVIGGIHYQALKLFLRRIPIIRKNSNPDLQRNYYGRKHHTKHIP